MQIDFQVGAAAIASKPERAGYLIVERMYAWFGAPPEDVPYAVGDGADRVIDVELVKAGGTRRE